MQITRLIQSAVAVANPLSIGASRRGALDGRSGGERRARQSDRSFGVEGLLRGRILGDRYRIVEVIGRGGMGVVYRAVDTTLEREVAVKVLAGPTGGNAGYSFLRERFEREARAAAAIRHPNVVTVFDRGSDEEHRIDFIVMELLEGEDLHTLTRRLGRPKLRSTVQILRQAAAGVAAGHRAGLVHRDIKPANLFLETLDTTFRVRVLDFGLADAAVNDQMTLAGSGDAMQAMSPAFASPEQLGGDAWVGSPSDVFSLGAVGYYLLTGRRLWQSLDPRKAIAEMEVAREELNRDTQLPVKLRNTLKKALASHPDDRFADAREMLVALDEIRLDDSAAEPTTAAEPEPIEVDAVPVDRTAPLDARPENLAAERPRAPHPAELPESLQIAGTALVLAMVGSICFLTTVAGQWNTMTATMTVVIAGALLPADPIQSRSAGIRAVLLFLASAVLIVGMVVRALLGSVVDLLFVQVILSGLMLWLISPSARPRPN